MWTVAQGSSSPAPPDITASDPLLTQNPKKRAGLDGNNGKSAERMVANSTKRSRNGSVLPLRQPHNPEVAGSGPASATIKSDQNRYTHPKPLRNQGFRRFYTPFFKACFIDTQGHLGVSGRI